MIYGQKTTTIPYGERSTRTINRAVSDTDQRGNRSRIPRGREFTGSTTASKDKDLHGQHRDNLFVNAQKGNLKQQLVSIRSMRTIKVESVGHNLHKRRDQSPTRGTFGGNKTTDRIRIAIHAGNTRRVWLVICYLVPRLPRRPCAPCSASCRR